MKHNLRGKTYGNLEVVKYAGRDKNGYPKWCCKCSCGKYKNVYENALIRGRTKSCCHMSKWKYGKGTHKKEYNTWRGMNKRCHDHKDKRYKNYGRAHSPDCSIERIDNCGNYEPSNCKWADIYAQANNKRSNVFVMHQGKRMTAAQWARQTGIKHATVLYRIRKKFPSDKILFKGHHPNPQRNACIRGHAFPENRYIAPNGRTFCRLCAKMREKRRKR